MKVCTGPCGKRRKISDFPFRDKKKIRRHSACIECCRWYCRDYYRRNKKRFFDYRKQYRLRISQILRKAKDVPCADCGKKYPYWVMDFDHLDGSIKLDKLSSIALTRLSPKVLIEEMKKCEVVCANCHRTRTHLRGQYRKDTVAVV